jgi:hypothetical protein
MIKLCLPFFAVCFCFTSIAQNVGIGTTTPSSKLEIKNPIKSIVKISSNNFLDTSQLIFSNRNTSNQGTDMQLTSNRESGLRVSSSSDLPANNKDTIMQITPTGLVGIRTATPQYPLDVKGDMNVTGELKANGSSGENGQFLRSNGNGTMSWTDKDRFKNFKIFRNDGSTTPTLTTSFTFPVGVTEVAVEIWGGGGQALGTGSGASGAYIYAVIPVGSFTFLNVNVGAGGGCNTCSPTTLGVSSSVTLPSGALTLTARGGYNTSFLASQGIFSASGSYLNNISHFGIDGQSAKVTETYYENSPIGYFIFQRNANGADAPLRPGTGGRSGWRRTNWDGTSPFSVIGFKGSEPGGGGGFPDADGGNGHIIIYW